MANAYRVRDKVMRRSDGQDGPGVREETKA